MIRSICLNPAVDRFYHIDNFFHGFQYKNNIPHIAAGGKGINVARAIAGLGEKVEVRGFVGGPNGEFIKQEMEKCGCSADWISVAGNTRVTINIIDNAQRKESEIVETGFTAGKHLEEEFISRLKKDVLEGDIIICSGLSLPGLRRDIYREISNICLEAGACCFLDTNGDILGSSIGGAYTFAKPNIHEILALYGESSFQNEQQLIKLGKRMQDTGIEYLMISMGSKGALLLHGDEKYRAVVPEVSAEKTIGCGDSAVAGYAAAFSRGENIAETFRFSMACAVANSLSKQLTSLDTELVRDLLPKIQIKEIV